MRAMRAALQLLTQFPVRGGAPPDGQTLGRSVAFYPWVGLLIGAWLSLLHALLGSAPLLLQAALLLGAWVLCTGALHLDGLADSADAWLGAHANRERALTILKDPTSGPAGVTAIVLVLITKFAVLASLDPADTFAALVVAPMLGRGAMTALFLTTPYVRRGGLGEAAAQNLSHRWALTSLLLSALVVAMFGWRGIAAIVVSAVLLWWSRRVMQRLLGGMTGDTLGATCEIVETGALVSIALVASAL